MTMLDPIASLIKLHRRLRRWSARHALPSWLADLAEPIFSLIRRSAAYAITLVYTICYARHFYARVGLLARGSTALQKSSPYPYLLRPFPYFAVFLLVMNVLKWLGAPWISNVVYIIDLVRITSLDKMSLATEWQYNIGLILMTLLLPVGAALAIVVFVIAITIFNSLFKTVTQISGNREPSLFAINWAFFTLIRRKRFWQGYCFSDLPPAMLFCSVNGMILWPLALAVFMGVVNGLAWLADSDFMWRHIYGDYAQIWNTLILCILALAVMLVVYFLVLRPVLYAFVFRSQIPLLRHGIFPDLLSPENPRLWSNRKVTFLNADLEKTSREEARFAWLRTVDARGRVFNSILRPPKLPA